MGVANTKSQKLSHPHIVNAHPVNWIPYAKFKLDWSLNKFSNIIETTLIAAWLVFLLDFGIRNTSRGCVYHQTTPTCGYNSHPVTCRLHANFKCDRSFN